MRVHIVCRQPDPTRILQRLANLLASGTGWTVGHDYDPAADLNYAFPYLDMRGNMPERVAALFTHREDIIPAKVALWRRCAEQAVLRITWASQYEADLAPHGPTRRILPPLDREHFSSGRERKPPGMQLRAGVSGYTYSGGRKGERLLAQTLQHGASQMFEWSGVGRGWPVPTRLVPYAELAAWYRSLDLYVCPSLIEGIPYGPLEALACGVPVVIPRGVGLLDDLPEMPGITRYTCGDVRDLAHRLATIKADIEAGDIDREALRAVTEPFTEEGWITGHLEAFADLAVAHQPARLTSGQRRGAGSSPACGGTCLAWPSLSLRIPRTPTRTCIPIERTATSAGVEPRRRCGSWPRRNGSRCSTWTRTPS